MDRKKAWNITKVMLKIAVTGLSLYLVFRKIDPKDLKAALLGSNHWFFLLAFLCFLASQLISSSRLNNFFRGIGLQLPEAYNFKLYLLGMFYNIFLPGGIGGDGYKVFFLRKKFGIKGRRLVIALFFDRLSGLWAMFVITAALVILIPSIGIPNWWPILAVLGGTLLYYGIIRKYFADYGFWFFRKHIKAIGVQSFQIIAVIMILYALHFDGKFSPYLFVFLASSLAALFPFTVGGLGAREIIMVYGANFFALDDHLAVLISLTFYLISALLSFCGSYFIFHPQALGEEKLPRDDKTDIGEMHDLLNEEE